MQKHWKVILLIVICSSSSFLFPRLVDAQPSSGSWAIDRMHVDIEIHEDATISVREEIATNFFEGSMKHGIFRDIPFRYTDQFGNRQRIELDVYAVYMDGKEVPFEISRAGRYVRIKIGDPDVYLTQRQHNYTIFYTVDRALLYLEDKDEFYWNVTGEEWEVPVSMFSGSVRLPEGAYSLEESCYTGTFGSKEQNCTIEKTSEDALDQGAIFTGDGFGTIAIGFTKGIVREPLGSERLTWFLEDNWLAAMPLIWIFFVVWFWFRHGRDPRMHTIIAEYESPNDLLPTYAGMFTRTGVVSHDISVMIITLASSGYLTIVVDEHTSKRIPETKLHFVKKRDGEGLDSAHKALFDLLFSERETVTLAAFKKNGAEKIETQVKPKLKQAIDNADIFTKNSHRHVIVFMLVGMAIFVMGTFFGGTVYGSLLIVTSVFSGLLTVCFGVLMPKRTPAGNELVRRLLGFKLYLETAETYRAKFEEDEQLFTTMLPYAIAFKLTHKWANVFKDINVKTPEWVHANGVQYGALTVLNDLSAVTTSIASAAAPTSSGSSGGGVSGGGFGGGGGGSW
ncbi:MAG: DUF2207 domain-containing protein [bacterium]|nr:DUF2207 domain-containing protein [bacterium]